MEKEPSTLTTMPVELVERIAELADPQDLIAFRRTCSFIDAAIKRPFTQAHFKERNVLLTVKKLRRAISIANSQFSPAITTLRIYTDAIDPGCDLAQSGRQSKKNFARSLRSRRRLQKEQDDPTLLLELLGKLNALNLKSIVLADDWIFSGRTGPIPTASNGGLDIDRTDCTSEMVLKCMSSINVSIKNFAMDAIWSLPLRILDTTSGVSLPLQCINSLSLRVCLSGGDSNILHAEAFADTLSKIPNLEYLRLRVKHEDWNGFPVGWATYDRFVAHAIFKKRFPALKRFGLSNAQVRFSHMLEFLQKAVENGLQSLHCGDLRVEGEGRLVVQDPEDLSDEMEEKLKRRLGIEVSCVGCYMA